MICLDVIINLVLFIVYGMPNKVNFIQMTFIDIQKAAVKSTKDSSSGRAIAILSCLNSTVVLNVNYDNIRSPVNDTIHTFDNLPERLLCSSARVFIGVVHKCQFAESFFYLVLTCCWLHVQYVVVILSDQCGGCRQH